MEKFSPQKLKNKQYEYEESFLSPYATKSRETKGRERAEEPCPYRTVQSVHTPCISWTSEPHRSHE